MIETLRRIGGAIVLCLCVAPAFGAETCPPAGVFVPQKQVTLSTGVGDTVYTAERSRKVITAVSHAGAGLTTFGLTQDVTEIRILPQIWTVNLGGGRYCVGLGRVEASWRITRLFVDIASEYPPGGCNYRVIREHEGLHVAFAHDTFREWTPRIEQALRDAAERIAPQVTATDPARVRAEMEGQLKAALQPAFNGFRADLSARNASIDTPENYRKTLAQCPRW